MKWTWCTWWLLAGCPAKTDDDGNPPPPPTDTTDTVTSTDCSAFPADGTTYDCTRVDYCDDSAANAPAIAACCACNPAYCALPDQCPTGDDDDDTPLPPAEGCMACHNGAVVDDYSGAGLPNPHPFGAKTDQLPCTSCHGGDPTVDDVAAHVPRPPLVPEDVAMDARGWNEYRSRVGLDLVDDYVVGGSTYSGLDYVQFLNPGDLRVVAAGRGCGQSGCHAERAANFERSLHATASGLFSATMYGIGVPAALADQEQWYERTAGDFSPLTVGDPTWTAYDADEVGRLATVTGLWETAVVGVSGGLWDHPDAYADILPVQVGPSGEVIEGSAMDSIVRTTLSEACAGCHAANSGPNDAYGQFRGGGCAACHFAYDPSGRTRTGDPNLPVDEPADPDALALPERPHVATHQIRTFAHTEAASAGDVAIDGIGDDTCATCHSSTNATALQYWGVRVDPNGDVAAGTQYPANPASFTTGETDPRLFDPGVGNASWGGVPLERLVVTEDYDGDGRDDTPPDVHAEAGMGCIDCHGSRDVHGDATWDDGSGTLHTDPTSGWLWSRMDQAVGITCASCHGTADDYAATTSCLDLDGNPATCAVDRFGNPLRNVTVDGMGDYWLRGRLDGAPRYALQVRDAVVDTGKLDPIDGEALYEPLASFAMGRADGDPTNGTGPVQANPDLYAVGFSHLDRVDCAACHASWTNGCVGCHLDVAYDATATDVFGGFSGEPLAARVTGATPLYATPLWSPLSVDPAGRIGLGQLGAATFWRWRDANGEITPALAFTDRNGHGNVPGGVDGRDPHPALAQSAIAAHSIRAEPVAELEGSRQCVACHLDDQQMATFGAAYTAAYDDLVNRRFDELDYGLLQQHLGQNPGNQLGSPFYVLMTAGLGTGLFLTDSEGCPLNPLDATPRAGCAPAATAWDPALAAFDLDGAVEPSGVENTSQSRLVRPEGVAESLRGGSLQPRLAGPLGGVLLDRLANPASGLVLDTWVDADGVQHP